MTNYLFNFVFRDLGFKSRKGHNKRVKKTGWKLSPRLEKFETEY